MAVAPGITPRQDTDTSGPAAREVVTDDSKVDVTYGTDKKEPTPASANRMGASQLRIALNAGGNTVGSSTGGANV